MGDLGVGPGDLGRHIAIDIGVQGLGEALARLMDAPFVFQAYSRLVTDCNRDPAREDAIPAASDGIRISGNENLPSAARAARIASIHSPYHAVIANLIDARLSKGQETILLSLHSFTPIMDDIPRPWDVGILHWRGRTDFAHALLAALKAEAVTVGDNSPYAMDATDYTVPFHAFPRNLRYAEIEIRQDLITNVAAQASWAELMARAALKAQSISVPNRDTGSSR